MLNAVSSLIQNNPIPLGTDTQKPTSAEKPAKKEADVLGSDRFVQYTRIASQAAGGGFAAYKLGNQAADSFKELAAVLNPTQGVAPSPIPSLQKIGGLSMKGAGLSALVAVGVSAVANGVSVARGQSNGQEAVQNVVSDGISGAIGGFGAISLAGAGTHLLRAFGMTGLPLTIGMVALGAVGGVATGQLAQQFQKNAKAIAEADAKNKA